MKAQYDATNILKKVLGNSAGNSIFRAVKIWTRPSSDGKSDSTIMRTRLPEKGHRLRTSVLIWYWPAKSVSRPLKQTVGTRFWHHWFLRLTRGTVTTGYRSLRSTSTSIFPCHMEESICLAQIHHEIMTMYSLKYTISPIPQSYFSMPLSDRCLCSVRWQTCSTYTLDVFVTCKKSRTNLRLLKWTQFATLLTELSSYFA